MKTFHMIPMLVAAAVCLLSFAPQTHAMEEFRVNFEKKTSIDRSTTDEGPGGAQLAAKGVKRVERNNFDATVSYSGLENAKNVTITFYIIGVCSCSATRDKKLLLAAKYEHPAQDFNAGQAKAFLIGPIGFPEWEVKKDNWSCKYGLKYEGWVAEFSRDGKVFATVGKTPDLAKKVSKNEIHENVPGFEKPDTGDKPKCVQQPAKA
ncbi:MAG: hypothetical protein ACAI35_11200 [Candidatus Methylacidiphilales bacterium]|nr:hypothetical protein [Candidatus Methylacidiphilales bacterium]